jgi:hypothetical protein
LLGFNSGGRRKGGTAPERGHAPTEQERAPQHASLVRALFRRLSPGGRAETLPRSTAWWRSIRRSAFEELQLELSRGRRYEHPFFVVRIPCGRAGERHWNRSYELASVLSSLVRSVDRVCADGSDVYLLLPECGGERGTRMLARISQPLAEHLSEAERAGISCAVFPDDGLTSGALLDTLHGHRVLAYTERSNVIEGGEVRSPPEVVSLSEPASVPIEKRRTSPEPRGKEA